MNWSSEIRRCFDIDAVLYTGHARAEMRAEEFGPISDREVREAMSDCEIIEEYPDDTPYPSVLAFGVTVANRPLHAVCAYASDNRTMIIVTVYQPDPARWEEYRRRRR